MTAGTAEETIDRGEPVESTSERASVAVISVPWICVPPQGSSAAIPNVVHETARLNSSRFAFTIVSGTTGGDPGARDPRVSYRPIDRPWDLQLERAARVAGHLWSSPRARLHSRSYHPFYAHRAALACRDAGAAVAIVHQFPQWVPAIRRKLPNARILIWAHAATEGVMPRIGAYLRDADGVIGCSRFVVDRFRQSVPTFGGGLHTVYNGYDPAIFMQAPQARQRFLLYVGRLSPDKGIHVLVDAFRELAAERPELELVLVGPKWGGDPKLLIGTDPAHLQEIENLSGGDYTAELLRRAGDARSRIRVLGSRSHAELAALYQSCAALVHPSLGEEGFGMPVVEAMACGAPVVVTRRGGLPEIVDDGETGILVPSGSVDALAAGVARVLDDPEQAAELGARGAELARRRFTWSASAAALAAVLEMHL